MSTIHRSTIHRHPLEITYEEISRSINRLDAMLSSGQVSEDDKPHVCKIQESLTLAYENVPKKYRTTYFKKQQEVKRANLNK